MWIFIVAAIMLLAVVIFLNTTGNGVETIDKAFAGSPKVGSAVLEVDRGSNKTIYTENGAPVDLSSMLRFAIEGNSLEHVGLKHGTIVYTNKDYIKSGLSVLVGRFIILIIDNERTLKEHPEYPPIAGYKARKVVDIFRTKMERSGFDEKMKPLLDEDKDVKDSSKCLERLWQKYTFASNYYDDDTLLIVSITYKDGKEKDYSFHSPQWLAGVVQYKNRD